LSFKGSEDIQPFLFNRCYRANHKGKGYSGLGLGLYISSEIIKKHGGEIGVKSRPEHGSEFWFTLPKPEKTSYEHIEV
jgi:signal transduction histidine kinase